MHSNKNILWKQHIPLLGCFIFFTLIFITIIQPFSTKYQSWVAIAPVNNIRWESALNESSGLLSTRNIPRSLLSSGTQFNPFDEFLHLMTSRWLASIFMEDEKIVKMILKEEKSGLCQLISFIDPSCKSLTEKDVYKFLRNKIILTKIDYSGSIHLSLLHSSAPDGQYLLGKVLTVPQNYLKSKTLSDLAIVTNGFKKQLQQNNAHSHNTIATMIEKLEDERVVLQANIPFVMEIIEGPSMSSEPFGPHPLVKFLIILVLAANFSLILISLGQNFKKVIFRK